ncbi:MULTISPECIES: molybdenum cofactor biosynthesis protein MoaE [unclassified Actinomyces]|uniref:molybdenum cofactor biosynthesis protein MoaE n=1 Tax=unclassified Actinomyces TaxID=2609248 RepID=UPI002016C12A|nr:MULTISPECIES: molybdenum cofactor biosynthesis protein MoaE [unclassified Actinomyces]MCL3778519.1 molybdenum cofactor biosynthesis protein MoaE [Actinomyces sp. AC-20-1]MCL3790812.1 molybdenum cofactor biosynthesis protein MoaE [Actinomyces sp. 187325]MCL3793109.1 molybdenum cofactor biosynthesis protein MoaE [Actinomyces sp. 186855]MCL3795512.1 molybdenum cofactor biosynthesis protein MoaE [Actinomyces sp. 217892]
MTQPRPSAVVVRAEVTADEVSAAELAQAVEHRAAGAVVTFDGMVRDHDGGRGVTGLTYHTHPTAGAVVTEIAAEVAARPGLRALAVVHRVGELAVGETALAVAVSADHRAPAFDAVRDLVEEVKRRLPVWKHQTFADGSRQWSNLA